MGTLNRAAIMRHAWALHREALAARAEWAEGLAATLRAHESFINASTSPEDRAKRIATVTSGHRQFVAREPTSVPFGDWLRVAWHEARKPPRGAITGAAAARMAADALPWRMEPERRRRLAELTQ